MALSWVKLHVSLLDNDAFRRLSPEARLTFLVSIGLAAKQNQGGALVIRDVGPMSIDDIGLYTGLDHGAQEKALGELTKVGRFLSTDLTGAYVVERFSEKAGDSSAARTRRYRSKSVTPEEQSRDSSVTVTRPSPKRHRDALEEEVDKDKDLDSVDSLRSSPARIPEDLTKLSRSFAAGFSNCKTKASLQKQATHMSDFLAICRSRGVTVGIAAKACADARQANGDKPLFGASVKRAIAYLPSSGARSAVLAPGDAALIYGRLEVD
jgi:hypothetical protein